MLSSVLEKKGVWSCPKAQRVRMIRKQREVRGPDVHGRLIDRSLPYGFSCWSFAVLSRSCSLSTPRRPAMISLSIRVGNQEQIQMIKRMRAATGIASTHTIASHGRRQ